MCLPFLQEVYDLSQHDEQWIRDLIAVYHDQLSYGKEIVELVSLFFEDELHLDDESREFMKGESIPNTLKVFKTKLEELEEFTKENIHCLTKYTHMTVSVLRCTFSLIMQYRTGQIIIFISCFFYPARQVNILTIHEEIFIQ